MQNVKDTRMTSIAAKQLYNFSLRCSLSNIGIHESINTEKRVYLPTPPYTMHISVIDCIRPNFQQYRNSSQKTIKKQFFLMKFDGTFAAVQQVATTTTKL